MLTLDPLTVSTLSGILDTQSGENLNVSSEHIPHSNLNQPTAHLKGKWSCTSYHLYNFMSNFMSCAHLSSPFPVFFSCINSHTILKSSSEALS